MGPYVHRLLLRLNIYCVIAVVACVSIGYRVHLLTTTSACRNSRRTDLPPLLHLDDNGAFSGDSECAFHFIWALAWSQSVISEFSSTLTPPPSHCTSFPLSYYKDAPLQARALIRSPSSCISILKLLVPLPSLHSSVEGGSYACWHLNYMARHFSLMRRVAEAPAPAGSPKYPLFLLFYGLSQKVLPILNRNASCCRAGIKASIFDVVLKMKHVSGITLLN